MLRRSAFSTPSCGVLSTSTSTSSCALFASSSSFLITSNRGMKIIKQNWFNNEAVPHARRVSWSPQTTTKKQGAFARLSRSNFYDPNPVPFSAEPYTELQVEAHRAANQQDIYIYKYSVSPTHLSLRTTAKNKKLETQ